PYIPVEEVVRVEGNDPAVGVRDVDAGTLHRPDVEVVGVEELDDEDTEHVVVPERRGRVDPRETAEQIPERARRRLRRRRGREEAQELGAHPRVTLIHDRV